MAKKRIVDLEKVEVVLEKLAKNPSLADKPREALNEMFKKLGIELTGDERRAFLKEVLSTPKSVSARGLAGYEHKPDHHLSGIIATNPDEPL
jgi:hypothetical protein